MARTDPALERAIERLLDAQPASPDADAAHLLVANPRQFEALRLIADVAAGCRRLQAGGTAPAPVLFHWGQLEVREQVAEGASADVYRAFDPALGVDVALKLRRDAPDSPPAGRFLDEARHLARVRQRNIVGIYGAGVHDGRAGLWCEWIEGDSLATLLRERGAFAAVEAAWIGIELCAALGALHGAGLLHGDVKPANVLRERGGRIVLVDLGAGGDAQRVNAGGSGDYATPAYLAPEVLAGAERRPAHDLYAVGRLVTTLLAGAADAALPEAVPGPLRSVLTRATQADPAQRYTRAAQLQDDLRAAVAALTGADAPRSGATRRRVLTALAVAAALAATALVMPRFTAAPWRTDLQLQHRTDAGVEAIADGAAVGAGERLLLDLDSNRPLYAYVLNEDADGALQVLFPLPGLVANPLPAGRTRLPGTSAGRELSWEMSGSGRREEFAVVLSAAPLPRLDHLAGTAAVPVERGVARVRADLPAALSVQGAQLGALLADLAPDLRDPDRVRARVFRFNDAAPAH